MGIHVTNNKIKLRGISTISLTSISGSAATGILLTDIPSDFKIYQRVGNFKSIAVAGTYLGSPDLILARAVPVGTPISNNSYAWSVLAVMPTGGIFSGSLIVATGGWYVLQVKDGVNPLINNVGTNKFAVGIIVALLGQSNMVGLATAVDQYPLADQSTRVFKDGSWKFGGNHDDTLTYPSNTPYSTYGGTYTNGDEKGDGEVFFANYLRSFTSVPVGVINKAVGGSAISSWQPSGGANYSSFISTLNSAGGDCEAVIWYQGEDDALAGTSGASYQTSLGNVLSGIRSHTGRSSVTFKFGVVTLGTTTAYASEGTFGNIRSAQLSFVSANSSNGVFYAATACDAGTTDGVHLGAVAQARLGKRYATALGNALGNVAHGMRGAIISSATKSTNVVTVNISHDGGTSLQDGTGGSGTSLLGFRVFDGGVPATISSTSISGNSVILTLSSTPSGVVTMDYAMANAPFTTSISLFSVVYDNNIVSGDTLGVPLQPKALFTVT